MIEIELHLEENLKWIDADLVQIEQVLINLAINARDAMADGGTLSIQTSNIVRPRMYRDNLPLSSAREWVSLRVSDTGQGMSQDILEKIFDPFFSTKASGKGTGLGLSMVHGIVKNHDGHITCHSNPGKGSCFQIFLPVIEPNEGQKSLEEKSGFQRGDETILLVEDDEVIQRSCKEALEKSGYTVLTVHSGEQALDVYRQKAGIINLVLLDLIIPGMGGVNCLYELFQIDLSAKVVIISGHTPDDYTMQVLESCINGYLRKPYTREQLLHKVRMVLDGA